MGLVPDIGIVFKLNEERKELRYKRLPFSVWSELKSQLGFTPTTLLQAIEGYDLEAIGAIIWLERKQSDRSLRWPEVRRDLEHTEYDFEPIGMVVDGKSVFFNEDAEEQPPNEEEEPDPTPASG